MKMSFSVVVIKKGRFRRPPFDCVIINILYKIMMDLELELELSPTDETPYDSFIGVWQLDPAKDFCQGIINCFENSKEIPRQRTDTEHKNCYEMFINATTNEYVNFLTRELLPVLYEEYTDKYHKFASAPGVISDITKIQKYCPPDDAYGDWHFERVSLDPTSISRHLVWMMYLNDVEDAGETEFLFQKIKVKPKAGKMVIWPSDWTHTHRGIPSPTETKYIATGWFKHRLHY